MTLQIDAACLLFRAFFFFKRANFILNADKNRIKKKKKEARSGL